VRFEVTAPAAITVEDCNCSLCARSAYLHLIVPQSRFRLLQGEEFLTTYTFGTGVAKHSFCKVCGIKSFYVPRSDPDGVSVNARCLDQSTIKSMTVRPYDGRNWEQARSDLATR